MFFDDEINCADNQLAFTFCNLANRYVLGKCADSPKVHRIPERLEPQHRITSLRRLPVILLNQVIQALVGPDERLSVQYALRLPRPDLSCFAR
jgi:hypothetical protein